MWQLSRSTEFDSNETNQAGAGDEIMSRSRDKLKTYLHYQSAYGHQTWQKGNLTCWVDAHKATRPSDHVVLEITLQANITISPLSEYPMATKFGRMVTYLDGLLPIKSHDSLIMWSCKITWHTKIIISPLPQCSCPPKLAGWKSTLIGSCL